MKSAVKKLIPKQIFPVARTAYRRITGDVFSLATQAAASPVGVGAVFYNRYGGYFIPQSARYKIVARTILKGEVWEPRTIEFIRSRCAGGDVIHAGAFFGDMFPGICGALAAGAKLWAFEPNSESYRCARITIDINRLANVELARAGLGEVPGKLFLRTIGDDGDFLGGTSRIEEVRSGEGEEIEIVRIDDAVKDRSVSVIHLDVEGHEKDALVGALQTLQRCRPALVLEAFSNSLIGSEWFAKHVISLGYREVGRLHDNAVFEAP